MKKVLIVEDQRMPRENMERILLDSGKYKLCASVNGADVALAVCRREKIDLILMDVCTAGNGRSRIFKKSEGSKSRQLLV